MGHGLHETGALTHVAIVGSLSAVGLGLTLLGRMLAAPVRAGVSAACQVFDEAAADLGDSDDLMCDS